MRNAFFKIIFAMTVAVSMLSPPAYADELYCFKVSGQCARVGNGFGNLPARAYNYPPPTYQGRPLVGYYEDYYAPPQRYMRPPMQRYRW